MPKSDPPKQDGKASEPFLRWARQSKHLNMEFNPRFYKQYPFTINAGLWIDDAKGDPQYVLRRPHNGGDIRNESPFVQKEMRLGKPNRFIYEPRWVREGKGKGKKPKAKVTKRK
jgi:hypothetical protein